MTDAPPTIAYRTDAPITAARLADVFRRSGIRRSGIRRPVDDLPRLDDMLRHANLLLTAWDGERLVGVARALTDFSYCCYLSDLAVDRAYQRAGVGRELLRRAREAAGEQAMLLLLAAPEATDYYPRLGMERVDNGWTVRRAR